MKRVEKIMTLASVVGILSLLLPVAAAQASSTEEKIQRGVRFLRGIETKTKASKEELSILKTNTQELEKKVRESKVQIQNLQSQLQNIDQLMAFTREKLRVIELQIAQHENRIAVLEDDVKQQEAELGAHRKTLESALLAYYLHSNTFFVGEDPELLAFLSSENNSGDILQEQQSLMALHEAVKDMSNQLIRDQQLLHGKQADLEEKKERLTDLHVLFAREERMLSAAIESRRALLTETQGKQMIYEELLAVSKREISQVSLQIDRLKENFAFFENKLEELKHTTNASEREGEFLAEDESLSLLASDSPMAWPVSPTLGLSAFFHDAAYEAAMGIPHRAIDVRITQGTVVRTAADGVVTKVADNGFAYSYVIIAHPDQLLTLYGHLSEILVSEGEIVRQGQVIGLSGGMPGTKGAGWLTTGPHLHFEVFKDWKHVDPLEYLPLEVLPMSSLPEKYMKRLIEGGVEKVRREAE